MKSYPLIASSFLDHVMFTLMMIVGWPVLVLAAMTFALMMLLGAIFYISALLGYAVVKEWSP